MADRLSDAGKPEGAGVVSRLVDLLADLLGDGDARWVVVERERLHQLHLHALHALEERLAGPRRPDHDSVVESALGPRDLASSGAVVRYRVLGMLAALDSDSTTLRLGGPRQRLVLALLLRAHGEVTSDDTCIDALWPNNPPSGARHTLQTYVSGLRRLLPDPIRRVSNGYVLEVDPAIVDVYRFQMLTGAAQATAEKDPAAAAALLHEALGLWRGEPYADFHDVLVLQPDIHRLQQARLEAVEDRIHAKLQTGQDTGIALELEQLVHDHPFRERLHGLLLLALYRAGRQADALDGYQRARRILRTELGIDPSPRLQRLHQQILEQDPALLRLSARRQGGVMS